MALTSAQSGENYRNWWPHPTMAAFTDHSTDLMEDIARATGNRINMTRRGYVLVTRQERPKQLLQQLFAGYGVSASNAIRVHENSGANYSPPVSEDWTTAPDGVDVLLGRDLIQKFYPMFDRTISTGLHIRRAGDISGQQLGQYMLETMRPLGVRFQQASVLGISKGARFSTDVVADGERQTIQSDIIVNAAGPFASHVSAMHGEALPIVNVLQQKIAFADRNHAIPRQMPFAIDLDGQTLAWSADEQEALATDPEFSQLLEPMPGNIHCRPDGGEHGQWIKLGWAYNSEPSEPVREPELNPLFPRSRSPRREPASSITATISRRPAARSRPLWRLLSDDQRKLASHWCERKRPACSSRPRFRVTERCPPALPAICARAPLQASPHPRSRARSRLLAMTTKLLWRNLRPPTAADCCSHFLCCHGRACPGHPRLGGKVRRGCPAQGRV